MGVNPVTSNPYLRARADVEAALARSHLDYIIARPGFITGADRQESRPLERLGARVADSALGLVGLLGGRAFQQRYRSISGSVLARALVRAADECPARAVLDSSELQRLCHGDGKAPRLRRAG